ncbi:DMT family transporter [Arthrobacter sp. AQ5-05]|uniref:DMT family transporter n=1 Tax=Arthrobacter sp. AQ5-05 TaxID=2184581 RepID=UPI0015EB838F|nr:DMT family transporter [Arthrobacter sp. AQ5-05]
MSTRYSPRTIMVAGVLPAVLAGHAMSLQARINGEMGIRLQDGVAAGPADPAAPVVPILAVFASGVIMGPQHGFNGTVAAGVGFPLPGALVNHTLGAVVLLAAWLLKPALGGHVPLLPPSRGCMCPVPWAGNLILSAILTRHIGILVTGLGLIAGQLIGALLLDMLLPADGTAIYVRTVVGIVIVLAAMCPAALGPRRPRSARAGRGRVGVPVANRGRKTRQNRLEPQSAVCLPTSIGQWQASGIPVACFMAPSA